MIFIYDFNGQSYNGWSYSTTSSYGAISFVLLDGRYCVNLKSDVSGQTNLSRSIDFTNLDKLQIEINATGNISYSKVWITIDNEKYFEENVSSYPNTILSFDVSDLIGEHTLTFVSYKNNGLGSSTNLRIFYVYGYSNDRYNIVLEDNPLEFELKDDVELQANFELVESHITTVSNPSNYGTTTGDGIYQPGDTVVLTAVANSGYRFISWTLNNQVVSTNPIYTFSAIGDGDYVANFTTYNLYFCGQK